MVGHPGGRRVCIQGGWADPPLLEMGKQTVCILLECFLVTKSVIFGKFAYREILNKQKIQNLSCCSYLLTSALPISNQIITEMLTL